METFLNSKTLQVTKNEKRCEAHEYFSVICAFFFLFFSEPTVFYITDVLSSQVCLFIRKEKASAMEFAIVLYDCILGAGESACSEDNVWIPEKAVEVSLTPTPGPAPVFCF